MNENNLEVKVNSKTTPYSTKDLLSGKVTSLPISDNALKVFARKYLVKNEDGQYTETPEDVYRRVARALALVEKNYGKSDEEIEKYENAFYDIMTKFEFTPAGRTLQNAGSPTSIIANCIVLDFEDSMEGIFKTLEEASQLQQQGSGLGFAWHLLRPAGYSAKRTMGRASGPVSFLKVFDTAFGTIKQQGRHGANMGIMNVDHPDILEFINCKRKEGEIRNFNISVGLTDQFMKQVKEKSDKPWVCNWKGVEMLPRQVIRDDYGSIKEVKDVEITATKLFDLLVTAAWTNGEPGVIFPDTVNDTNPLPKLGRIEACNPCGEQMLHAGDVCNLGSIILDKFVIDGAINWERMGYVVRNSVRMLDNVVDMFDHTVERVQVMSQNNRRLGLGVMGFADMLYDLNLGYDTEEGRQVAEKVMSFITNEAHKTSNQLAEEKGVFPNYRLSVFAEQGIKMRNAALTTVAPTGSISMLSDVSSGIEPYFSLAYSKKMMAEGNEEDLFYINRHFLQTLKDRGIFSNELVAKVVANGGSVVGMKEIPQDIQKVFVTSMDISAEAHIRMQATFQKYTDNSISKTINFNNSATVEDMKNGYMMAWELGCKGCTVYRDGSRDLQVLSTEKTKTNTTVDSNEVINKWLSSQQEFIARPRKMSGNTYKQETPFGDCYVTINSDENDNPFEIFITIGKAGSDISAFAESLGRMISLNLRMPSAMTIDKRVREIIDNLIRIGGSNSVGFGKNRVISLPDAVSRVLLEHIGAVKVVEQETETGTQKAVKHEKQLGLLADICPECGVASFVKEEGCQKCYTCGYSKC
ncbi:MAG: adenosylcobalamin-dependent ribonucleoside-diphosphate reductase [bacterium]|nr:adenosylcobalamin-dependent ribonucleoside-diphosphate reductase [bacterium]